jgi:hypothetical protein
MFKRHSRLLTASLAILMVAGATVLVAAMSAAAPAPFLPDTGQGPPIVVFRNEKKVLISIKRTTVNFPDYPKESLGSVTCTFKDDNGVDYLWDHDLNLYKRSVKNPKIATYGFVARGGNVPGTISITIDDKSPFGGPGNVDLTVSLPGEPGGPYPCPDCPTGSGSIVINQFVTPAPPAVPMLEPAKE